MDRIHSEEPRWNYADDGEWDVIDQHVLPNRAGGIAETRLRESVTERHDRLRPGPVIVACNQAACSGDDPEPLKIVPGNVLAARNLGLLTGHDIQLSGRAVREHYG